MPLFFIFRLDYFIVFLQQYYWSKKDNSVPESDENSKNIFPVLIDQMFQECLHTLRPNLKLYKSLEEANNAVQKLKEKLCPDSTFLGLTAGPAESIADSEGLEKIVESETESDDQTDDDTVSIKNNEDTEEEGSASGNCLEYQSKRDKKSEDDVCFEQMFEKLTLESYQERLKDINVAQRQDIPVPVTSKHTKKTYNEVLTENRTEPDNSINFTLIVRGNKAGKQQLKQFKAPIQSQLAQNLFKQKELLEKENESVKRLTLNITERIEEEDYQESLSNSYQHNKSSTVSRLKNKSSRYQFKHQKGVPNPDDFLK